MFSQGKHQVLEKEAFHGYPYIDHKNWDATGFNAIILNHLCLLYRRQRIWHKSRREVVKSIHPLSHIRRKREQYKLLAGGSSQDSEIYFSASDQKRNFVYQDLHFKDAVQSFLYYPHVEGIYYITIIVFTGVIYWVATHGTKQIIPVLKRNI